MQAEACAKRVVGALTKVIAIASRARSQSLYPTDTVQRLMDAAAGHVSSRSVSPAELVLFYVRAVDDESLLRAFDFCAMPAPLDLPLPDRLSPNLYEQAMKAAYQKISSRLHSDVKNRVAGGRSAEPLLLPPRNFVTNAGRMADEFVKIRRGLPDWHTCGLQSPARVPGASRCFTDSRGLLFKAAAPGAMHGQARQVPPQQLLRGRFRFGAPLRTGFHHDVSRSDAGRLDNVEFECCEKGPIRASGTHANIYPNDYVRW